MELHNLKLYTSNVIYNSIKGNVTDVECKNNTKAIQKITINIRVQEI